MHAWVRYSLEVTIVAAGTSLTDRRSFARLWSYLTLRGTCCAPRCVRTSASLLGAHSHDCGAIRCSVALVVPRAASARLRVLQVDGLSCPSTDVNVPWPVPVAGGRVEELAIRSRHHEFSLCSRRLASRTPHLPRYVLHRPLSSAPLEGIAHRLRAAPWAVRFV